MILVCKHCHQDFNAKNGNQKYCSPACQSEARSIRCSTTYRQKHPKIETHAAPIADEEYNEIEKQAYIPRGGNRKTGYVPCNEKKYNQKGGLKCARCGKPYGYCTCICTWCGEKLWYKGSYGEWLHHICGCRSVRNTRHGIEIHESHYQTA